MTFDAATRQLDLSVTDPAFVQDPYAAYSVLHGHGGRFFWSDYGFWCFAGYEDVDRLLRDRRFGREVPPDKRVPQKRDHLTHFDAIEEHSLLELEPPAHTKLRRNVNRAFVSRQVEKMRPQIERQAQILIDQFPEGPFDLLEAYATPLALTIISEMMGIPERYRQNMLDWSHAMVKLYTLKATRDDEDRADAACAAFIETIRGLLAEKRADDDGSLLAHMAKPASGMSDDEIISTSVLLMNAGHEATVHQIGNAVWAILSRNLDGKSLFSNRDSADRAVEELLRLDAPLHLFTRQAKEPVDFGDGIVIAPGETIGLLLGAANRDPSAFQNPHLFDPNRTDQKNVTFGAGIHFCIGAPLARLEIAVALTALFSRHPSLKIATPPRYADSYHFHGLETLLVTTV